MLDHILKLKEVQLIDKKSQESIKGGSSVYCGGLCEGFCSFGNCLPWMK